MTGKTRSSEGLDHRRKRILFRCWQRGTREMDLILGRFADAHVAMLSEEELAALERLMDLPDVDLFAAFSGKASLPPQFMDGLFERIKAFDASELSL